MSLGNKLKCLREKNNLTQSELAKILNKSRSTIAGYEINDRQPDLDTLQNIAEHFNVTVDYLIGLSNVKTYDEHIFHSDFNSLSKKLESANPEVRKIVVSILDKIFLTVFYPLDDNDIEFLTKLKNIYYCIHKLNSSLESYSVASDSKNLSLQDKLKILSKYKNDLNILLDDLFEYYLNKEKPTE